MFDDANETPSTVPRPIMYSIADALDERPELLYTSGFPTVREEEIDIRTIIEHLIARTGRRGEAMNENYYAFTFGLALVVGDAVGGLVLTG
jgi:hypothetical protein